MSDKKMVVHIFVPGIRTKPGASNNWSGRATTWVCKELYQPAEKVEYYTPAILRPFGQDKRAMKLQKIISFYAEKDFDLRITCHSNGQDVVLDALTSMDKLPVIQKLTIISGAGKRDCNKNGLNSLEPKINEILVMTAGKDLAMKLAKSLFGRILGYGATGERGLQNPSDALKRKIKYVHRPNYGHGTWFTYTNFQDTMEIIVG